jgi:hypothetical protein
MRGMILTFLVVIAVGGATGASSSDPPYGAGDIHPPSLPPSVTCAPRANGTTCFYPAQSRYFFPTPAR